MLGSWQLVSEEARNVFWHGVPGGRDEDRIKEVKKGKGFLTNSHSPATRRRELLFC